MTRIARLLHGLGLSARHPARSGWCALVLVMACAISVMPMRFEESRTGEPETTFTPGAPSNPAILSPADRSLYAQLFEQVATDPGVDIRDAATRIANQHLLGYVLAERYLSPRYDASAEELNHWLARYSDHPHAMRVARLAIRKGLDVTMPKAIEPLRGDGFTDHLGRRTMPDTWFSALANWREGNYRAAMPVFVRIGADDSLSDWQRAAGHYWSYRTADKLGNGDEAEQHLAGAASYPTTFYGLLAAQQLGRPNLSAEAPEVSDSLREDGRAIRAALLAQLGRTDDAEHELRILYSATDGGKRPGIITLASEMGLPNFQLRLARLPDLAPEHALFANYPMPHYMVELHDVMDSALLLAVARNESSFREVAASGAGAVGMMQMLPSTARAVERHVGEELLRVASREGDSAAVPIVARLSDPAISARYGAEYLRILMREKAIGNDFIRLLVGYNAGPGTVASWQSATRNISDPLLYIESIPYPETRNYVMQVSAQYWVYQLLMDEKPQGLAALARGEWPRVILVSGA